MAFAHVRKTLGQVDLPVCSYRYADSAAVVRDLRVEMLNGGASAFAKKIKTLHDDKFFALEHECKQVCKQAMTVGVAMGGPVAVTLEEYPALALQSPAVPRMDAFAEN